MEITNEIKVKVFCQYYDKNQAVKINERSVPISFDAISLLYVPEYDIKLILKPLSSITDEDAIEVAKMRYEIFRDSETKVTRNVKEPLKVWFIRGENEVLHPCEITEWNLRIMEIDFLKSKGYDLPNYYLGGKTLHEAGLAIYE